VFADDVIASHCVAKDALTIVVMAAQAVSYQQQLNDVTSYCRQCAVAALSCCVDFGTTLLPTDNKQDCLKP